MKTKIEHGEGVDVILKSNVKLGREKVEITNGV